MKILSMLSRIKSVIRKVILRVYPEFILNLQFKKKFGYSVDWKSPRDLNEKILWLLCKTDTTEWTRLADKVKVRDYVRECGLEKLLIPLLGTWETPEDIDFSTLPDHFVLKCNHDSGSVVIVDKEKGFDKEDVSNHLDYYLRRDMGNYGEFHYSKIYPKLVLAETELENTELKISSTLIDYRVWCFKGQPYCIMAYHNKTKDYSYIDIYDCDWQPHQEWYVFSDHYRNGNSKVPRPLVLDEMLSAASILSQGIPEVRIDFYISDNRLYFGEMTFTSVRGMMTFFTKDVQKKMGDMIDLSKVKQIR